MAGTMVFMPGPPYPAVSPTTSAVGRTPIRSSGREARLAVEVGDTPAAARNSSSSKGWAASDACSAAVERAEPGRRNRAG